MADQFFRFLNDMETLEESGQGLVGRRVALVNTGRPSLALAHRLMPDLGDPWDESRPELILQKRSTSRRGGTDNADGVGGWTNVTLEYGVPGNSSTWTPNEPGVVYTDAGFNNSRVKVYTPPKDGLAEPAGAYTGLLNNGQGVDIDVAELAVTVFAHYAKDAGPSLAALLALTNKVNVNPVVLPPLLGCRTTYSLAAGQLRTQVPKITPKPNSIQIAWGLVIAEDHYARFRHERADGTLMPAPPADPYFARTYQRVAFPSPFPG